MTGTDGTAEAEGARRLVTCRDDLDRLEGYASLAAFVDAIENQTDAEVYVNADETGLEVICTPGGGAFYPYPFDPDEVLGGTYDSEIVYEVTLLERLVQQIAKLLDQLFVQPGQSLADLPAGAWVPEGPAARRRIRAARP